jgi:translation initiation factor 2 subunit 1
MSEEIRLPQKDELVVGDVRKVMGYGAFCALPEYPGVDGFLHVSEVASKWIRNIGDYVKENQRVVVKVLGVEPGKNVVDVSLRRVNENERKQVLEFYNSNKKAERMIEIASKKSKTKIEMAPVMKAIAASYSSVYDFAIDVYEKGASAAEKVGIPEKAAQAYSELVQASFKPSRVTVKAEIKASSLKPNGIEGIKSVLSGFEDVSIKYLGAPRYMLSIEDESFKKVNKRISATLDSMEKKAKPLGVSLEYEIMKNERNHGLA